MSVTTIPRGSQTIIPYLLVPNVAGLIDFLRETFDASEIYRSNGPNGTVIHAQLKIGTSIVMMGEAKPDHLTMPTMLYIYVHNVDEAYRMAIAAGATSIREPMDEYYGDRTAGVQDVSGNQWWIASYPEEISTEELARREAELRKH